MLIILYTNIYTHFYIYTTNIDIFKHVLTSHDVHCINKHVYTKLMYIMLGIKAIGRPPSVNAH